MFLAVALDDSCRNAIATHLESLPDTCRLPGKPVPPENWHITLRFLGPTSPAQRDRVVADLDQHTSVAPFRIRLGHLGGFPRESRASVLWVGATGNTEPLVTLAEACETAAQQAGFEPEERPFHPHLTLSRIRPPADVRPLIKLIPNAPISIDVDAVTLYRSVGGNGPSHYEVIDGVGL
ncbi:MAG: RNA 2',3'-cyclic phosphodiesterase [Gaiellaceae bacterium]